LVFVYISQSFIWLSDLSHFYPIRIVALFIPSLLLRLAPHVASLIPSHTSSCHSLGVDPISNIVGPEDTQLYFFTWRGLGCCFWLAVVFNDRCWSRHFSSSSFLREYKVRLHHRLSAFLTNISVRSVDRHTHPFSPPPHNFI
jgi:hypothetical protein